MMQPHFPLPYYLLVHDSTNSRLIGLTSIAYPSFPLEFMAYHHFYPFTLPIESIASWQNEKSYYSTGDRPPWYLPQPMPWGDSEWWNYHNSFPVWISLIIPYETFFYSMILNTHKKSMLEREVLPWTWEKSIRQGSSIQDMLVSPMRDSILPVREEQSE